MSIAIGAAFTAAGAYAQVSLYTTVDQALRTSASVRMATADVQRAAAGLTEAKDVYIPSFLLGSSVGYSYGFPIGQPSIVNVQSQSLIFTFSQMDYIRSARAAWRSAQLALSDVRQQVVLDTALDYIQLDVDRQRIEALDQQNESATKLTFIEQQRLDAGVGTKESVLGARLVSAQLRLKRLHIQDDMELLRQRLAHLTGLPADSLVTIPSSIPPSPDFDRDRRSTLVASMQALNTDGVRAAYATAQSHQYQAFGDARQNYRPQIGFGGQYSRFSEINNYQEYYQHFQHNNFEAGLQITVPLFDATKRAKESQSRAEAFRATAQADQLRDQSSENIVLLEKSLEELSAQKEVAQLQNELAQSQLDAVLTQLNGASVTPGAAPLTPREEQQARIEERRRYEEVLDATFEMTKAQLGLLRATGGIEEWYQTLNHP
ncbi:Outer membrane protein [Acidisarcina polymorpha]|uniref:Outer membrane protein n=1 Tax=Acidisarcina polymorpha TaxID=2211140 RepID=A0A2Z5FUI9_9BACT|nr:TolC family protein [Acidisarcina polymorpha]AXC10410.1 Outer membrane protein [Acidisarcina polymorpha]